MRKILLRLTVNRFVLILLSFSVATVSACNTAKMVAQGGGKQVAEIPRQTEPGPYVLILAFDGVGYHQLNDALHSGKALNLAGMLGADKGGGVYENAYSAPNAISILPSTTMAAWSAIFTGTPTAYNGVPGNEWFVREQMTFYAPAPVSIEDTDDVYKTLTDGLVGNALRTPTLYEQAGVKSAVSLNAVYRGADYFTTIDPTAVVGVMGDFLKGTFTGSDDKQDVYVKLDQASVPTVLDSMTKHGMPKLQTVYFPGIDLYTHLADDALNMEVGYIERITDPLVGTLLEAYKAQGILDRTYIVIIADHGHTPVDKDSRHALGADPDDGLSPVVTKAGFRIRKFKLKLADDEQDFQAVFAYQGAIAYIYLADRSECRNPGAKCDWPRPPRYEQDVMALTRALYKANRTGAPTPKLKGTIDLIFARRPSPPGKDALPYEIFDGKRLVPIADYLAAHPRPDLIDLDKRMRWLSAGPYGNRAGDILLLTVSGLNHPIDQRFYFSGPYHSWHGSASEQDGHIPLVVARAGYPGVKIKELVDKVGGEQPSQLSLVPIVRALLTSETPAKPAAPPAPSPAAAGPSKTLAAKSR
jgi:Type I phosphodiesterase / nucleotide pyrophosphatase